MRRLVAVLMTLALALSLVGCGGGDETEGTPAETPAASDVVPPPPVAIEGIPDRSNAEDATVFEEFPEGDFVPAKIKDKLADGQPMLILFVDGSQHVTNEVRSAVDRAIKANSGVVDLVMYDLGKYASIDASGNAVVDSKGIEDDDASAQAVTTASQLKVTTLPYILMTDDQGYIVFRHRGLVDDDFLKMHMERLTD